MYHERQAADSLRYSQGSNDGADFKQLLDASFDVMMRDGGFPGHEGNRSLNEFLVRRQDSQPSFNSFNLLNSSFSFKSASQNSFEDDQKANIRKRVNGTLHAFLAGTDEVISLEN